MAGQLAIPVFRNAKKGPALTDSFPKPGPSCYRLVMQVSFHDMEPSKPTFNGVNLQDPIVKTVGSRRVVNAFEYGMKLQKAGSKLYRTFRTVGIPKGVYRFHTHEEADEWLTRMLARKNR